MAHYSADLARPSPVVTSYIASLIVCMSLAILTAMTSVTSGQLISADNLTNSPNVTRFALSDAGPNKCPRRSSATAVVEGRTALLCANRCREYGGCVAYNFRGDFLVCELFTEPVTSSSFFVIPKCRHMVLQLQQLQP